MDQFLVFFLEFLEETGIEKNRNLIKSKPLEESSI